MKHIILIIVIAIIAYATYSFLNTPNSENTRDVKANTETTAKPLSKFRSSDKNAKITIISPKNGDRVTSPIKVVFGSENIDIRPAGTQQENSGHHHLLINEPEIADLSQPLPVNEQVIHFGKGQNETTIELGQGEHTLQLLLGNYLHVPHQQPLFSEKITITVE